MAGNQSFEAPEAEKAEPNPESDSGSDSDSAESGSEDGEGLSDSEGVGAAELGEPRESETLAVASSITESGSQLLSGSALNSTAQSLASVKFKEQAGVCHQEVRTTVTAQTTHVQTKKQLQSSGCPTSSVELSPTSVTQSIQSAPSPTILEQRPSPFPKVNSECMPEGNQKNSSDLKTISTVPSVKTPSADGYNWRKYGQKQVKSPKGSRSYYKCTYSDCYAKKIECCDDSGQVIEIIYKSRHNHDPPRKINCMKEGKLSPVGPVTGNSTTADPVRMLNDSDPSTSSKEPVQETPLIPERKRPNSDASDENAEIKVKEEHIDEPEPKRRSKKSSLGNSGSHFKPGKKPKFVVHAAGDVGISGDGYRWRKYGQKMVKGNPHPRNYYRCTSAGCPVRKHIETAIDNTSAVIITYKGIHDHDMPVPKKRHGPPSAPLVAAAAPASMNSLQFKKTEAFQNQISSTQWSVDMEGELAAEELDPGGEKAMESARTLLSIGFEIKPC